MQFHEYMTLRQMVAKHGSTRESREAARRMTSEEFRDFACDAQLRDSSVDAAQFKDSPTFRRAETALSEQRWVQTGRPFYNVWPVAVSLARSVRLDVPFSAVQPRFSAMLLRFARGHAPFKVTTALLCWHKPGNDIHISLKLDDASGVVSLRHWHRPDEVVQEWLTRLQLEAKEGLVDIGELMIRLLVFIALLSQDRDMVTPVVLSKDQQRYDAATEEEIKRWLENRATRRGVIGFDVARRIQEEKERSPHWRNPHLALFWVGKGREKAIIKMRRGCVVLATDMSKVPTGYLGPEAEVDEISADVAPREPISKSRRFAILKRDNYRCKICGASAEWGAVLHVDHRVARAQGGSNEDDNLWTLCEACNLGKSDESL